MKDITCFAADAYTQPVPGDGETGVGHVFDSAVPELHTLVIKPNLLSGAFR